MKRILAVGSVAGLFLTGVAVGLLVAHLFYAGRVERFGGAHEMAARHYHDRVGRRLDLSPEQWRQVDEILHRTHERAAEIRRRMRPEVEARLARAADDIAEILDDEQRRRFEALRRDRRRWSELFLLGPPAGPGPPGHGPREHLRHPPRRGAPGDGGEPPAEPSGTDPTSG